MVSLPFQKMKYFFHIVLIFLLFISCAQRTTNPNQFIVQKQNSSFILLTQNQEEGESLQTVSDQEQYDDFDDFGDDLESEFEENEAERGSDPLEGYNRFMTSVNDKIYIYALDPITNGYRYVMPAPARRGIGNFFHNLLFPLRFASNILQAKFENSAIETGRFLINSTIGILGIFDPAESWFGLAVKDEDFGQALGYWGVGAGPHLVLPVLGPSNLRDVAGFVPDADFDVLYQIKPVEASYGSIIFRRINSYSLENLTYTDLVRGQLDRYLFLKDAYESNRNKKIQE